MRRLRKQIKTSQAFQHVFSPPFPFYFLFSGPRNDLPNVPRLRVDITSRSRGPLPIAPWPGSRCDLEKSSLYMDSFRLLSYVFLIKNDLETARAAHTDLFQRHVCPSPSRTGTYLGRLFLDFSHPCPLKLGLGLSKLTAKPLWLGSFHYKWGTLRLPVPVATCETPTDQNPYGRVHNPHGSGYG